MQVNEAASSSKARLFRCLPSLVSIGEKTANTPLPGTPRLDQRAGRGLGPWKTVEEGELVLSVCNECTMSDTNVQCLLETDPATPLLLLQPAPFRRNPSSRTPTLPSTPCSL